MDIQKSAQRKRYVRIHTDYIAYIGCVQAIKSYIHKAGPTTESNSSTIWQIRLRLFTVNKKAHAYIMKSLRRVKIKISAVKNGKQDWIKTLTGAVPLRKYKVSMR